MTGSDGRNVPTWTAFYLLISCLSALVWPCSSSPLPDCNGPRVFHLTLTWESYAPDGFSREMTLVNGQFPGPLLEINQGDDVEVHVYNKMPFNTTIHYHGIEMQGTPWSDGVPGVSQRYIYPGANFTYKWTATQYGSYWYHAHERGQIDDGLYGPILVHPKRDEPTPFAFISNKSSTLHAIEKAVHDSRPLVLSDFQHMRSFDRWDVEVASGIELPCYDSILFNGKGRVDCWSRNKIDSSTDSLQKTYLALANLTKMTDKGCLPPKVLEALAGTAANLSVIPEDIFNTCTPTNGSAEVIEVINSCHEKEKWLALDIIGTFGLMTVSFSIDGLPMYIYAVDGSYIKPQLVDAITITNGDRYSVLIKLDAPGRHTIRAASVASAQMIAAYATIAYRSEHQVGPNATATPYIDDKGVNTTADVIFFDQAAMKAYPPAPVARTADQTLKLSMRIAGASWQWALNETVYPSRFDSEEPLLFLPRPNAHDNVTITTHNDTWVDLIFVTGTYPNPPHPIHKHGSKMYLIGHGYGVFNYSSVAEAVKHIPESFNLVDPPRRDGFATPAVSDGPGWMAVRYHVTNPGAWLLHCHIQSHLLGGMSMVIQDGVDYWPTVPQEYLNYI